MTLEEIFKKIVLNTEIHEILMDENFNNNGLGDKL